MRKQLLLFILLVFPLLACAEEVKIGGLWYNLDTKAKVAEVIQYKNEQEYSDDIEIPEVITYDDVEYDVISIGDTAFGYCSGLTSVTIPNSVTTIGDAAFVYCSGLTSITIPNSVTSILEFAFMGCSGLTSLTIGNGLITIGDHVFSGCTGLTSITIPNSITTIGEFAFDYCSGLTSVTIPNSVTTIEDAAFGYCTGLTSITIPNSVTSIGSSAFYECSGLTSVTIGNSVTSIGSYAFSYCSGLTDVYCYAEEVPTIESDVFDDSYIGHATLHVPESAFEAYRTTEPWNGFGTIVVIDGETPFVEKCATPTITYSNGKVRFACETEGVEYVPTVTVTPNQQLKGDELEIGGTFTVSVYAKKEGYDNSDVATIEINMSQMGDVNADGELNAADITAVVNAILGK